jgi:hypothetical protein
MGGVIDPRQTANGEPWNRRSIAKDLLLLDSSTSLDNRLVTVDWGEYQQFDPGVFGPLRELPRREARGAFNKLMAEKEERINALRDLLRRNGVELGSSDSSLQDLNDWFHAEVRADPEDPDSMRFPWYGVATDIGLHIGEVMVDRVPELRWEFFTGGKKDIAYQRAVIMGFSWVPNTKYNVDPQRLVVTYGSRIVVGEDVEVDAFWRWVRSVELRE